MKPSTREAAAAVAMIPAEPALQGAGTPPRAPARLQIGSIEVTVMPPDPPAPAPVATAAGPATARGGRLSRDFASMHSLRQG